MPSMTARRTLPEIALLLGTNSGTQHEPLSRRVDMGGVSLHYLEWGERDKPCIVLLHSAEETAHSWDLVGLALGDNYRVIALDARGFGESDRNQDGIYGTTQYLEDLERFVKELALDRFVLVGQARGARQAMIFAALHPTAVRAAVLIDTAPEVKKDVSQAILSYLHDVNNRSSYEEFVSAIHASDPSRPIEHIRTMLWHQVEQGRDGQWVWKRDMRTIAGGAPSPMDSPAYMWKSLADLQCPTLLMRGEESPILTGDMAARMLRALPDAQLEVIPHARHLVAAENPVAFETALRHFLDRVAD
jgi:esterase